jgi:hypothetical protein
VKNHWHATLRCKSATRGSALRYLKAFQLSLGLGCAVSGAAATAALADVSDAGGATSGGGAGHAAAGAAHTQQAGAPAMPPPARATVLAKLPQPAVATMSTADALVSLATGSDGGARGSRNGSALFAAAASMASVDVDADAPAAAAAAQPRVTAARSARAAAPAAAAQRDSAATAEAVLSPLTAPDAGCAADAPDDADAAAAGEDPRDTFLVSDAPLLPLALLASLRRVDGLHVQEFAVTAGEAQRLTFARSEGRAQLAELAAKLRRRCPDVRAVALAMRAGDVAPGERVYAGALAVTGDADAARQAVAFVADRLDLLAKLMREPSDSKDGC